jgi:hypothetical protein
MDYFVVAQYFAHTSSPLFVPGIGVIEQAVMMILEAHRSASSS